MTPRRDDKTRSHDAARFLPLAASRPIVTPARFRSRNPRAFIFFEVMIMLALLGAFALVATRLLLTSMKASIDAQQARETALRFDLAINRMRADVWSAREIESDGLSATLHQPGGRKIIWQVEPAEQADPTSDAPTPFGPAVNLVRRAGPDDRAGNPARNVGDPPAPAIDRTNWDRLPSITFEVQGPALRVRAPVADDTAATGVLTLVSQLRLAERAP